MIGTVRWFNLQKGYGFIHADDESFNIFVDMSAVERAGMSDLKEVRAMSRCLLKFLKRSLRIEIYAASSI
jgi:cold shock CspA family protein